MSETFPDSIDADSRQRDEPAAERRGRSASLRDLTDDELERATVDDRRFFARNPHRQYRVRKASAAEIQHLTLEAPPLRWHWHVVIASDMSLTPFIAIQRAPGEVGEREALRLFKSARNGKWRELFRDAWRLAPIVASAAPKG